MVTIRFKPMLAATLPQVKPLGVTCCGPQSLSEDDAEFGEALSDLVYPVLGSIKRNGVRIVMGEDKPLTRTLKPIRNIRIHNALSKVLEELPDIRNTDCELVTPDESLEDVTGLVNSVDTPIPKLYLYVFDSHKVPDMPFKERYETYIKGLNRTKIGDITVIQVGQYELTCPSDVVDLYNNTVSYDYEGIMLRDPDGTYKYGRSTLREQGLVKMKPLYQAQARILEVVEQQENRNTPVIDNLGHMSRSSAKANKVPKGTAGALRVEVISGRLSGVEFIINCAVDDAQRKLIWEHKDGYIGRILTFNYRSVGKQCKPREATIKHIH